MYGLYKAFKKEEGLKNLHEKFQVWKDPEDWEGFLLDLTRASKESKSINEKAEHELFAKVEAICRKSTYHNNGWFSYNGFKEQLVSYLFNLSIIPFYLEKNKDKKLGLVHQGLFHTPFYQKRNTSPLKVYLVTSRNATHDSKLIPCLESVAAAPNYIIEEIKAVREELRNNINSSENYLDYYNVYAEPL